MATVYRTKPFITIDVCVVHVDRLSLKSCNRCVCRACRSFVIEIDLTCYIYPQPYLSFIIIDSTCIDNNQSIDMGKRGMAAAAAVPVPAVPAATIWPAMASQAVASAIDPDIVSRISHPENFGGVCAAANFIVEKLRSSNLASEIKLSPKNLGLHPSNRGSYGCHEDITCNSSIYMPCTCWTCKNAVSFATNLGNKNVWLWKLTKSYMPMHSCMVL
jgi:hypothetical protein